MAIGVAAALAGCQTDDPTDRRDQRTDDRRGGGIERVSLLTISTGNRYDVTLSIATTDGTVDVRAHP